MVVTVHDMTFDLFPEVHTRIKRLYFPFMIRRAVKQARAVLAVSRSTAHDLAKFLPDCSGKVVVTPLAARSMRQRLEGNPSCAMQISSGPYALFIGTLEPRKNLERLLISWHQLDPDVRGTCRLLVIGARGWMIEGLDSVISKDDSIEFLGYVDDTALDMYLSGAMMFVYPSLYEGFGLPVIEAMAAGVPVLTSNVGATKEIAAGAALLVDPRSVDEIRFGLSQLLTNQSLRVELGRAGLERAASFSWQDTANLTLNTLLEVGRGKSA